MQTLTVRRMVLEHLVWWLDRGGFDSFGPIDITGSQSYLALGHLDLDCHNGLCQTNESLMALSLSQWKRTESAFHVNAGRRAD